LATVALIGGLFLLTLVAVECILRVLFGPEGPDLFDQDTQR
jgi:hypothetical protein